VQLIQPTYITYYYTTHDSHKLNRGTVIGVRARELGGCPSPDSGKTIIFQAKAEFFGQKPAAKNEKKHKVPEIWDFY